MININKHHALGNQSYKGGYSVLREVHDADGLLSSRFIGTYETIKEAEFIAKKAEKMEKASILIAKVKDNPDLNSLKISDIKLNNVTYNIHDAVTNNVTPRYTNGVSNIIHHIQSLGYKDRWIQQQEDTLVMSFKDFVMNKERGKLVEKIMEDNAS